jgi:peptidoglycan/LPS O-acetylase OafA/YrhL
MPPVQMARSPAYRPDVDGLRAVAVIAVILNHLDHRLLPGGYLGVDIFFVISGFVITTSLRQRADERLAQLLSGFFARRFRRLVPALALCVAVSGLAVWIIAPNPRESLHTGLAALVGVSNISLLWNSQDYFATATAMNFFTQTWSLGVEEQFYLLFPFLVWASGLTRLGRGPSRLFAVCLVLSALSVVPMLRLPGWDGGAAYFLVLSRFWELGCGVMAALLPVRRRAVPAWIALAIMVVVMALPLYPSVLVGLLIVPLTVVVILGDAAKPLAWPAIVGLGRMSYSLYLWHWPVISGCLLAFGRFHLDIPARLAPMLLLGIASYFLVERPARTRLAALPRRWSFVVAFGSIGLTAGFLMGLNNWTNPWPLMGRVFTDVPPDFRPMPVTLVDHYKECVVDGQFRFTRPETFDRCTLAPYGDATNTVWAMGDSHAGALEGMLVALYRRTGLGIHLVETPGRPFPATPGLEFPAREALFATTMKLFKPGDIVLLSRLYLRREGGLHPMSDVAAWIPAAEALAARLRPLGVRVVVAGPLPYFHFDTIYRCARRPDGTTPCDLDRAILAAAIEPTMAALEAAARRQPNLHVFDDFTPLCPPDQRTCSPVKDDIPLYRDEDHLNALGAEGLAPAFEAFLSRAGLLHLKP